METVQTVKCGYESPMQAANGAAMVQIGKVKYLSVIVENVTPDSPTVSRSTSRPVPMGFELKFWEIVAGGCGDGGSYVAED